MRIGGQTSPSFSVSRGIRQGSVLSPTLFLLVIDPILLELNRRSSGPSICGLYLGAFAHADNIRTLATNITDCKSQISYISEYISSQGLALNVDKCEATISPSLPADSTHIQAGDVLFPLTNSAKCLGALWTPNLSCSRWIKDNIKKARRAMFAQGSGVFHSTLNPLSSKRIIEHCVLPCLLYGVELWLLNPTLIQKLESFQTELAKRILQLPRCTSNNTALIALQWPSMRTRVLIIKLSFLLKIINSDCSLSARVFRSLTSSDMESLLLTRQCRFLESSFQSDFTSEVLASSQNVSNPSLKKAILHLDLSRLLADASAHPSQKHVAAIASNSDGSWLKLWDVALDKGVFGTTCIQAVLRFLSLHSNSDGSCPVPSCSFYVGLESPCAHFLSTHAYLDISLDSLISSCVNPSDSLFQHGKCLHSCFKSLYH